MFKKILNWFRKLAIGIDKGFLCDTCLYDYPDACNNSKRPNVQKCSDYKSRT